MGYIVTGSESSHPWGLGGLVFTNSNPAYLVLIEIIFAGEPHGRYALFMPIEWVYRDIKELTGATYVRFRL